MSIRTVRLALAAALAVASVVVPAGAVSATSCVAWSGFAWQTIADGSAMLVGAGAPDERYFDVYDMVVIGEVVDVAPATFDNETGASVGGFAVTIETAGAIRMETVAPTYVLYQYDMGGMSGYPFIVGQTYMVPLQAEHPDRVSLCDAVVAVTPQNAEAALALAAETGVDVAAPTQGSSDTAPMPGSTGAEDADGAASTAWQTPARWIGVALVVALVSAVARRRRQRLET